MRLQIGLQMKWHLQPYTGRGDASSPKKATHTLGEGTPRPPKKATQTLGEGTPRPPKRHPHTIKGDEASPLLGWQMVADVVADKTEHLQPRQVIHFQRVSPYFKTTVAEWQIKSKKQFLQSPNTLIYKINRPPLAYLPKKLYFCISNLMDANPITRITFIN